MNRDQENGKKLFQQPKDSSTTFHEYPVLASQDGKKQNYNYDQKKPKQNPGPFRAITDQNKDFKGVICHDGDKGRDGRGNPNGGSFHRLHPQ